MKPSPQELLEIQNAHAPGGREHWSLLDFISELDSPDSRAFYVRDETGVQGFVLYRVVLDEAWILNLAVRDKGRGLGRALLDKFLGTLVDVRRVGLEVSPANARAVRLYAAAGFAVVGLRKAYYASGEDAQVMVKDL